MGKVVGMERLAELEHDVVGRVDDVADAAEAHRLDPPPQPVWTRPHRHVADHRSGESRACRVGFDRDPHARSGCGSLGHPPDRRSSRPRSRKVWQPPARSVGRGELPRDAFVAEQIGPHRRHVELEAIVAQLERGEKGASRCGVGGQGQNTVVIGAQPELPGRAEHAFGYLAPDLPLLEFDPAGEGGADRCEGVFVTCLDIGSATDHVEALRPAGVHGAEPEPVGIGMRPYLFHLSDDDVLEIRVQGDHRIDRSPQQRQSLHQVADLERLPQKGFEPSPGNFHRGS